VVSRDDFSKLEIHTLPVLNLFKRPYLIRFILNWFSLFFRNIRDLSRLERVSYWNFFKCFLIYNFFFSEKDSDFVIVDEDPFSLLCYIENEEFLNYFLSNSIELPIKFAKSSIYIFIKTDNHIALNRVKDRTDNEVEYRENKELMSKITQEEWDKHYKTREENEKKVLSFLNERGENVIQLNGTDNVSDNVDKIIEFIESLKEKQS